VNIHELGDLARRELCAEVSGFLQGYALAMGGWADPGTVTIREKRFFCEQWVFADFDFNMQTLSDLVDSCFGERLNKLLASERGL
jgi:hypothetical protein